MSNQAKYTNYKRKFADENYDRIALTVPKGKKETIKAHADGLKESVNKFINRAIDETMQRDNSKQGETDNAQNTVR